MYDTFAEIFLKYSILSWSFLFENLYKIMILLNNCQKFFALFMIYHQNAIISIRTKESENQAQVSLNNHFWKDKLHSMHLVCNFLNELYIPLACESWPQHQTISNPITINTVPRFAAAKSDTITSWYGGSS